MKTPHVHAELIKQWADGANIEWKSLHGWLSTNVPSWDADTKYRVKPEPVPDRTYFGILYDLREEISEETVREQYPLYTAGQRVIKITVKTDENGKETRTVEIVE